jgi:hypothetical protein
MVSSSPAPEDTDPFVLYSRELHDYTLRLWTESRRVAEEKNRAKAAKRVEEERKKNGLESSSNQQSQFSSLGQGRTAG